MGASKFLGCTVAAVLIACAVTEKPSSSSYATSSLNIQRGDVDMDGRIDASDASYVLIEYSRLSTGGTPMPYDYYYDVNGDETVDASDASWILALYSRLSTGGGDLPPIETSTTEVGTSTATTSTTTTSTTTTSTTTTETDTTEIEEYPAFFKVNNTLTLHSTSWNVYAFNAPYDELLEDDSAMVYYEGYIVEGDRFKVVAEHAPTYLIVFNRHMYKIRVFYPEDANLFEIN